MKIKRFEFNMFPENCYVIWDETNEAAVIDPGCYYEEEKQALKDFILKNGLNVKHLLNTHLHLDHIFGNPFMLKEFGLKAEANQADEFWIDEAPKQSRMFGFPLHEKPVPLGGYLHDGDTLSPSDIPNSKPSMCPDIPPAAWYSIALPNIACSRAMSSSKAASDEPTWLVATSTT